MKGLPANSLSVMEAALNEASLKRILFMVKILSINNLLALSL